MCSYDDSHSRMGQQGSGRVVREGGEGSREFQGGSWGPRGGEGVPQQKGVTARGYHSREVH